MTKHLYVGLMRDKESGSIVPVSAATTKRKAGELLENWVKDFDPNCEGMDIMGVYGGILSDYIDLGDDRHE